MSKPKLPPVNQVEVYAGSPADVKRALGALLATPGFSVQTMLQTESAAYNSLNQAVERSMTVTVVFRQYEVPAEEAAPTGAETAILPREEGEPSHVTAETTPVPVGDEGVVESERSEHPGVTDMPDNTAEHP